MKTKLPFHLSLPCYHVKETRDFYLNHLGGKLGRHTSQWVDINMYGTQLTFVKAISFEFPKKSYSFEGVVLPHFHFGVVMEKPEWNEKLEYLSKRKMLHITSTSFLEEQVGNHDSFFVLDPNHFVVEFKCMSNQTELFKS